jgi:Cu(I)/Ag(I) efflux system membrane fusion protein
MTLLGAPAHQEWMAQAELLGAALGEMSTAGDLDAMRAGFAKLSERLVAVTRAFGPSLTGPLRVVRCPMAFGGQGALWLQRDAEVRNPYMGAAMPTCGEVLEVIGGQQARPAGDHEHE